MTAKEFSNEFDILYNNLMSNSAPGLNEYVKSVLLTQAQEEIVKNYFDVRSNRKQLGIDDSIKRQLDFSTIISVASLSDETIQETDGTSIDDRGALYLLPENLMFILNEQAKITRTTITIETTIVDDVEVETEVESIENLDTIVIPISYSEYTRLMNRPYKEPLRGQSWRMLSDGLNNRIKAELIVKNDYNVSDYKVRYVRIPYPIILVSLHEYNTSINGFIEPLSDVTHNCELPPAIHTEILNRAVELAKTKYLGDTNTVIEINNRNE